jgi:threonine dehydratase
MLGLPELEEARTRLAGVARTTPVYGSSTLSRLAGREVVLKAENLQRTGSFKIRGAVNRIGVLTAEQRAEGVVAASAGNHGQAVAWAAREAGVRARIFVPEDAATAKVEATRNYGAEVVHTGESFDDCLDGARVYAAAHGAVFVHPFDDPLVIAGQGTIGLELAEQVPQARTVVVPIGGGGLISGVGLALRALRPDVRVVGVRADKAGFAIADGIAVKEPGRLTAAIAAEVVDEVVTVGAEEISQAIVLLLERTKLVVEGAGAVGVAAVRAGLVGGEGPVAIVLSGGNIDPTMLLSVARHGLTTAGRYLAVQTRLPDRPGELLQLLALFAEQRANVVTIEHYREGFALPFGQTGVEVTLATRDEEHCHAILEAMAGRGYPVERLH